MKHLKRLMAVVLAAMLLICTGVTALAAPTDLSDSKGTITLNGTVEGKEYRLYKIFDVVKLTESTTETGDKITKVYYSIANGWTDFFTGEGAGVAYLTDTNNAAANLPAINVDGTTKFINITEDNVAEFAQAALPYAAQKAAVTKSVTANDTTYKVEDLALGYYLVYPVGATDIIAPNGSLCSLTTTDPNATINIKAEYPTFSKTVDAVELEGVQLGQKLNYELKGNVPDTTGYTKYIYEFKDTMSKGLTFNKDVTITVAGQTLTEDYFTLTYNDTNDGFVLTIKVLELTGQTLGTETIKAGDPIVVSYTATTNADGLTKISRNKATLTYSVDPSDLEKTETIERDVPVYTTRIVVDKYDADDKTVKLPGAKFVLKNADGKFYQLVEGEDGVATEVKWVDDQADATEVTTDANGFAEFKGLKPGTYELVETVAPEGYNLLTAPVEIIIKALQLTDEDGNPLTDEQMNEQLKAMPEDDITELLTEKASIENNGGIELPGTGGIGTTIFYALGGLLVVGAVVLLITRKRMSAEK